MDFNILSDVGGGVVSTWILTSCQLHGFACGGGGGGEESAPGF